MEQKQLKPREIFLNACAEIAQALAQYGFKPMQKGQRLKKTAADRDMDCEIYFQSGHYNYSGSIAITPHLSISSKELEKWMMEQTKNEHRTGAIYGNSIGYVSPYNEYKKWNLAGNTFEKNVQEIIRDIQLYFIPIANIFENKNSAIEYLKTNGTKFNKWTRDKSLLPMAFMIHFGGKEAAEMFLKNYIETEKPGKRVKGFYKELETTNRENIDPNDSEFFGASEVKLAYINGIEI